VVEGTAVSPEIKEKIIVAAGNVQGVAQVEALADGPEPVFHVVKKGDTLSEIAQKTLGKASRYPEIFEANRPIMTHPDKIYLGQTLRIPAK
jgi:nucleoid-associated protein YgaU